jgi:hypothetical protein
MNMPEHFHATEDYLSYRPVANVSLSQAIDLISAAIAFCREQKVPRLLVDTTKLTGVGTPTVVDRFEYVERWARDARGSVKVVVVARPEIIDPERFGVVVARNRGFWAHVFTAESEALDWLLDPDGA